MYFLLTLLTPVETCVSVCADINLININLFRLCFPPGVEFLCLVPTLGKTLSSLFSQCRLCEGQRGGGGGGQMGGGGLGPIFNCGVVGVLS